MINEDYVSFEIAKLLKEKGFHEDCKCQYGKGGSIAWISCSNGNFTTFARPTIQMTMKWLREKHLLHISIDMVNGGRWEYEINDISNPFDGGVLPKYYCDKSFSSYEEGINDAIKYCLEHFI